MSESTDFAVIATPDGWVDRVDELASFLAERFHLSAFRLGVDLRRGEAEVATTPVRANANDLVRELEGARIRAFVRAPGLPAEHIPPPVNPIRVATRDVETDDHPEAGATVVPGWVGAFGDGVPRPEEAPDAQHGTVVGRPGALFGVAPSAEGAAHAEAAVVDEGRLLHRPPAPTPAAGADLAAGSTARVDAAPQPPADPGPWSSALDDLARADEPSAAPTPFAAAPISVAPPVPGAAKGAGWAGVLGTSLGGKLAEAIVRGSASPPAATPADLGAASARPPVPDVTTLHPSTAAPETFISAGGGATPSPAPFDGQALAAVEHEPIRPPRAFRPADDDEVRQAPAYQRLRQASQPVAHPPASAALWSLAAPGAGQAYNHEMGRGLFFALTSFLVFPWIWSVLDAARRAAEIELEPPRVPPDSKRARVIVAGFWSAALVLGGLLALVDHLTAPDLAAIEALGADNGIDTSHVTPIGPSPELGDDGADAEAVARIEADHAEAQRLAIEARRACDVGDFLQCRLLAETALDRDDTNADALRIHVEAIAAMMPDGSGLSAPSPEPP